MNYFSISADFIKDSIYKISQLNRKYTDSCIYETYGQMTIGNLIGSGRANDLLPYADWRVLEQYVQELERNKIAFNYTLNSSCLGNIEFTSKGLQQICDFVKKCYQIGIKKFTVCLPSLIEIIQSLNLDIMIKGSTLCQINNVNKAIAYKKMGIKHIVVDENINRKFKTLHDINVVFDGKTELIVNVICYKNCIYEMFHHNQTSHDKNCNRRLPSTLFYSHKCVLQQTKSPSDFLRLCFIRPEDIPLYESINIHYFKIQGRQAVINGDILKTVESYMAKKFDGNLIELLNCFQKLNNFQVEINNAFLKDFIKPFYDNDNFCKDNCLNCDYCTNYINSIENLSKIKSMFSKAQEFYGLYNEFERIKRLNQ